MRQNSNRRSKKTGLPPGSPVYIGSKQAQDTKITIIGYDENSCDIRESANLEDCLATKNKFKTNWISISGLSDAKTITTLCNQFGLHPLVVEDIFNTHERPKIDIFNDYIFITLRSYSYNQEQCAPISEQISIILGKNFVFTIQEVSNNTFNPIKERLQVLQSLIHSKGTDYLAYVLIDVVVDNYFEIIERIGDEIECLEEKVAENPDKNIIKDMHEVKREIIYLRKSVWPMREVISGLQNHVGTLIKSETLLYLKDIYEHTVQIIDTVETYRDFLASILDIYLSSVSNKMNEVMKVLTVFAAIFIPLTFITGIYGMNFNTAAGHLSMPELNWKYGYLSVWGIMITVTLGMLVFFKRKRWW